MPLDMYTALLIIYILSHKVICLQIYVGQIRPSPFFFSLHVLICREVCSTVQDDLIHCRFKKQKAGPIENDGYTASCRLNLPRLTCLD